MFGFKFNGVHSSSFGLVMQSKNRPILPEPKIIIEDIPARNGVYDFSESNPYGHIMYKEREVSVDCKFVNKSIVDLRKNARKIAAWLALSEGKLIFDDEPCVFYLARVSNRIDLEHQISKIGSFTIVFTCRPFAYSVVTSGDIPSYGDGLYYDDHAFYGGNNVFSVTGYKTFNVVNYGTYVKPIIILDGTFDNVLITYESKSLQYLQQGSGVLSIDCEKNRVTKDGLNVINYISGEFFELVSGDNIMEISGTNLDCNLYFVFNYLYF